MMQKQLQNLRQSKYEVIRSVQRKYAVQLYGKPPHTKKGIFGGGSPPDMKRLTDLLFRI